MSTASLILAFVYLINVAKGKPSLVVLKNIEQPITSTIIMSSGRNLTIACKIVNFTDDQLFDSRVVWSKKTNDLRFPTKKELKWPFTKKQIQERSTLIFEPVRLRDGGTYVCSSVKYNLSKVVALIVRPDKLEDHLIKRQKRAQFGYGSAQWADWNNRRKHPTESPALSLPDPMRDSFSNFVGPKKRYKPTEPSWIHIGSLLNWDTSNLATGSFNSKSNLNLGNSNLGTSWPSHSYGSSMPKWNPDSSLGNPSSLDNLYKIIETNYPDTVNDNSNSKTKSEYGVLYFMAAVGGLLLFSGIMCMCIRNNPNLRMQMERSVPAEAACPHPVCRIHRNSDPSVGCLFEDNPYDSVTSPPPLVTTTHDDFVTVVNVDRTPDTVGRCRIDSPPSYASSIRNSVHSPKHNNDSDLPPSYDEALANMQHTAPPNYFSLTGICSATPDVAANCSSTAAPPDVVLNAPRCFARFVPSFLVNNRP